MNSLEYPKTENVFTRDPDTHKLNVGDLRLPEFWLIKGWHVTEKIDGTNMRVCYDPKAKTVEVRGRTDRAQSPPDLVKTMEAMFPLEKLQAQFDEYLGDQVELGTTVTIYGEGYGAGIQKGGTYSPTKKFRVFDVCYHRYHGLNSWCNMDTVRMICNGLDVPMVPFIAGYFDIASVVAIVDEMRKGGQRSATAVQDSEQTVMPEGVIARTNPYLYDERGRRIMWKLKVKDLP